MRFLMVMSVSLLLSMGLYAETFEEYQAAQMKEFNAYKDALDKEFTEYLNQPWKPYKSKETPPKMRPKPSVLKPIEIVTTPLPVKTEPQKTSDKDQTPPKTLPKEPVTQVTIQDLPTIKNEVTVPKIKEEPKVAPIVVTIPPVVVTPQNEKQHKTRVSFYGQELFIKYDNPLDNRYSTLLNQDKLTAAWQAFATSEYVELLDQIKQTFTALNLNDWGELKMIEKIGDKLFRNSNETRLFTWFLFTKMGKDIKIGYERNAVVLMTPINTGLYSTTYFTIGGKRYYAIDYAYGKKLRSIKTYEQSHPSAKENFDLRIDKRPNLKSVKVTKELKFEYHNKEITVPMEYDKVYVAYYKDYPQVDFDNYFKAPISPTAHHAIMNSIAKLIEGKGEVEAVNILLSLVQKGFDYKVDESQFGFEKVMLPEETLFYPYSDCEDRSILFARLVKDLLGLKVVGIEYSQHLATAVVLKSRLSGGSSFVKNGKRYYMADPTYIGSTVGMVAPVFKNAAFKVIYAD